MVAETGRNAHLLHTNQRRQQTRDTARHREGSLPLSAAELRLPVNLGDRHFTVLLVSISYGGLRCPSVTHGLALVSHYFKSITCVCSVIFSLQRHCMELGTKPAPCSIASSSSARATHSVPVMQTEHVQQLKKVCYSRSRKFFTVLVDPE